MPTISQSMAMYFPGLKEDEMYFTEVRHGYPHDKEEELTWIQ